MGNTHSDMHQAKKEEIMVHCFECYAEHGLSSVGIKGLAQACGISSGSLYFYFENLDDLIVQSTAYCMSKVEDDFMARAPRSVLDLERFIDEVPQWTADTHGKKYRLMYQIYTHPKYREHGKAFFEGVNKRYAEYAKLLEKKLDIPGDIILPLIFVFVRACVHYALFGDEFYLKAQVELLKKSLRLFFEKYNPQYAAIQYKQ